METIDGEFRPGGRLHRALDGSTTFRRPGFDRTIRGRSWAIHDGIGDGLRAGGGVGGVKMYKAAGRRAGINTFPGAIY